MTVPRLPVGATTPVNACLLYVVGQLGPGGSERQLYSLLYAMDRTRYRPAVAVWNYRSEDTYVRQIQDLGVPVHYFSDARTASAKMAAFRRLAMRLSPQVIHSYSFYTNSAAWAATLGTKAIALGSVRGDFRADKRSCGFFLGNLSARWPRVQIYNSFVGAQNARHGSSLFAPARIFVVRNAVDLAHFKSLPPSRNGRVRIVGVGSLSQGKRWDRLLDATSELMKRDLDFRVAIAGDGPMLESLKQQARSLNIADRVNFIGHATDVPDLIANATFLVHTSDSEGCPNAVVEAMACGRAVVATDAGDVDSIVEEGKTGFVVQRGDHCGLVERLATLITDRPLCLKMGEAARATAERQFGLDRLVSETFDAYKAAGWRDS